MTFLRKPVFFIFWLRYKKSGCVRSRLFIKRLWASQTSENIFYKTKVVPFEILILKRVNKIKIFDQVMTLLMKHVFFHFPGFTDFRVLFLLLVKIFLNFKNGKKAMSLLFLKLIINFLVWWSLHAQNAVRTGVPR